MKGDEPTWFALMDRLADLAITSLASQVHAGAQAVQLFDSWAGSLSEPDYRRYVMPSSARVLAAVRELGVPSIHFGVGTGELLGAMGEAGADIVGVDWRVPLDVARTRVGDRGVQGNLDPAVVLAPWPVVEAAVHDVLDRNGGRPGHIFNLGHGVLPETDPEVLTRIVEVVHGR
jgi:uroporphyrinogen decarboxylase